MQFIHQPLAWGFLIVLVPMLIHLINMVRRRRVKWAAMDFLLQSYRKHRKWVWLKQLLLLAMRMAAVALIVAMLAGWVTQDRWLAMFGARTTHYYVLLDDSYSMSERVGGASAFEKGLRAVGQIAAQAKDQEGACRFTLIRFSRVSPAAGGAAEDEAMSIAADFNAALVDANFGLLLEERRNTFEATQLPVGPRPALEAARQLMSQAEDESRLLYLVSDFRANQWDNPAEIRKVLGQLQESGAKIQLVGCAGPRQANAAITEIRPADETRAAGVPLFVEVSVKNFGVEALRNLPLKIRTVFFDPAADRSAAPGRLTGQTVELPTVLIDEIPPNGAVVRKAQVYFAKAGRQVVESFLPDDSVAVDNRRWCVIDFPDAENVLIVDGHPTQRNAYYLESAFQPGRRAVTGIRPERKTPAFLRDTTLEKLSVYSAIYLLDIDRLDDRSVENLEAYTAGGGGLGFFVGEHVNIPFYNQRLYREGQGLFPLPLDRDDLLPPELSENTPDIEVSDHPVFRAFLGERNPLIRLVSIDRYLKPLEAWLRKPGPTAEIAARLRNRMPLAVARQFGRGRVFAFLTTLAPDWNNWGQDPSFVVVALQLQSYLAAAKRTDDSRLVGAPIELQLDARKYRKDVTFVTPSQRSDARVEVRRTAVRATPDSPVMSVSLGPAASGGQADAETNCSGVYEAWPITLEGAFDARRVALNVDPAEGDLTVTPAAKLLAKLSPVEAAFRDADEYQHLAVERAGYNRGRLLMGLLIALLFGEQVMAYFASYHPARGGAR